MSNMHYFNNQFSKIAKNWAAPPPTPRNLRCW